MLEQILRMQAEKHGVKCTEFKQELYFPCNKQIVELTDESQQVSAAVNFVINYTVTQGINSAVVAEAESPLKDSFSEIQVQKCSMDEE